MKENKVRCDECKYRGTACDDFDYCDHPNEGPRDHFELHVRGYNVGSSDYSSHEIQPWDIWLEYDLNPWDADIIKRVLRDSGRDDRELEYDKIIHICQERKRQLKVDRG